MFQKTKESKVMRDAIHGYIHVDLKIIWDLINAKEFQRLRRIHQLGGVYEVYHNAEHSRFSHSLGVYEIVRRMVYEVEDIHRALSEYEKVVVMIAALLHDVGHLAFSHALEEVCDIKHETFSMRIITQESDIHEILMRADKGLANAVASVIAYKHPNEILNQMISGQLDADRMDYLLRDAYFTGTSYGKFDLERILRTIRVKDHRLVVKESGMHSVEDYIMARYHMYWQVYFHPVARSFEFLLCSAFKRMKEVYKKDPEWFLDIPVFIPFLKGNPSVYDHYRLDDYAACYGFSVLMDKDDVILRDLSKRILERKLLEYENYLDEKQVERIKNTSKAMGFHPAYYVHVDKTSEHPYSPYGFSDTHNIYVLTQNDEVYELSNRSVIVKSLVRGDVKEERKVYYPV